MLVLCDILVWIKLSKKQQQKAIFNVLEVEWSLWQSVLECACVSESWYHVNVLTPAPTSRTLGHELWKRKIVRFYVFNLCLVFCLFCTITFFVFDWSRTKTRKNFQTILFFKRREDSRYFILKRCSWTEVSFLPLLFFSFFAIWHTSVQSSIVTYHQHSDWQQRTCYKIKGMAWKIKGGVSSCLAAASTHLQEKNNCVKVKSVLTAGETKFNCYFYISI